MGAVCSQHGNCAIPDENMLQFTTWDKKQVGEMLERYRRSLYSSFALNVEQTQVLLDDSKVRGGRESVNDQLNTLQTCLIFKNILDTDQNNLIDGYETVSVVIMLSSLTTSEKLDQIFQLYNYAKNGYLFYDEIVVLLRTIVYGLAKVDRQIEAPPTSEFEQLANEMYASCSLDPSLELSFSQMLQFCLNNATTAQFLDYWNYSVKQNRIPSRAELFSDPEFPPSRASLFWDVSRSPLGWPAIRWKRIRDLYDNPILFADTPPDPTSVKLGPIRDGTVAATLGMLSTRWNTLQRCFLKTGQEHLDRFCVKLYLKGHWTPVYVDTFIPVNVISNRPVFCHSREPNEYWMMLMEKSLAKALGCYQALIDLPQSKLLHLLTGSLTMHPELSDLGQLNLLRLNGLLACSFKRSDRRYCILKADATIVLTNPFEQNNTLTMLYDEFVSDLARLHYCPLEFGWQSYKFNFKWSGNGGGSINHSTWVMNPQLGFEITSEQTEILIICDLTTSNSDVIGLMLSEHGWEEDTSPGRMSSCVKIIQCTKHFHQEYVWMHCTLDPGQYMVVPMRYRPDLPPSAAVLTFKVQNPACRPVFLPPLVKETHGDKSPEVFQVFEQKERQEEQIETYQVGLKLQYQTLHELETRAIQLRK